VHPGAFALGAGAGFIARAVDVDQKGLPGLLNEARDYEGAAFVEILQNCIVYNADIWDDVSNKKTAAESRVICEHGKPLVYGADGDKGLRLDPRTLRIESVALGENGVTEDDLLVHDETNPTLAQLLLTMEPPLPTAMGVIHRQPKLPFEESFWRSRTRERRQKVVELLQKGNTIRRG